MGNCFLYKRGMGSAGASEVVYTAMGKILTFKATDKPLKGLRIFGKTTQNGTPTPDAPVPLESVGDGGSVGVTVCGKNLLKNRATTPENPINGVAFTVNNDGSITADGTASDTIQFVLSTGNSYIPGTYILSGCPSGGNGATKYSLRWNGTVSIYDDIGEGCAIDVKDGEKVQFYILIRGGVTVSNLKFFPMLRLASVFDDSYEPYEEIQTLPITGKSLPGIPVTSGGNYVDENGQQWVCDEVDFARGKYVQRVNSLRVTEDTKIDVTHVLGNCTRNAVSLGSKQSNSSSQAFSTHLTFNADYYGDNPHFYCDTYAWIFLPISCGTIREETKAWMIDNQLEILYKLTTPIETDLTAEQLASYAELHTNYPSTTIYNGAGANMEVKYL